MLDVILAIVFNPCCMFIYIVIILCILSHEE